MCANGEEFKTVMVCTLSDGGEPTPNPNSSRFLISQGTFLHFQPLQNTFSVQVAVSNCWQPKGFSKCLKRRNKAYNECECFFAKNSLISVKVQGPFDHFMMVLINQRCWSSRIKCNVNSKKTKATYMLHTL